MIARRTFSALVAAIFTLTATTIPSATDPAGAARGPVMFGAHAEMRGEPNVTEAFAALERKSGRLFDAARIYAQWDEVFPDPFEQWLTNGGRTLVFSVKARRENGTDIPWASIAAARPGSALHNDMKRLGDQFKAFERPMYVTFHHEPEAELGRKYGTAPEFVAAWRNFVSVVRGQGATNVKFLLTMVDLSFKLPTTDRRAVSYWYPGDDFVDAIGADAYNWYSCRGRNEPWTPLAELIEPLRQFGAAHPTKELWLPEFGTAEDPADPNRKARWLTDAAELFTQPGWGQFRGLMYFHDQDQTYARCQWWLDTTPQSMAGFAKAGEAAVFGGGGGTICPGGLIRCGATASAVAVREGR